MIEARTMGDFAGLGERIRARLRLLGYWKNDRPDVLRFCEERRYRPQYVYAWLKDRVPTHANLSRLAGDLGVPMAWIMFGHDAGAAAVEQRRVAGAVGREVEKPVAEYALAPPSPRTVRSPRPVGVGGEPVVLDFKRLRDVTERLVQLEAELHGILKAFPDGYFWLDAGGKILSYQGGLGIEAMPPPEGLVGKRVTEVLPDGARRALHEALREALETGAVVAVEYSLASRERPRCFEARFVPIAAFSEGRRLLGIVRDITERKQTEEATRALVRIGHELAATLDPAQASQRVAEAVLGLFRVRGSALYRLEPGGATLRCMAAAGCLEPIEWAGKSVPVARTISGLAVTENRPVTSADALADPRVTLPEWAVTSARADGWGAVASVPLTARGSVLGSITLADGQGRVFTSEELDLLSAFAGSGALAIQNAELYAEAEGGRRAAESLAAVGRSLSQSLDPNEVGQRITERVLELLRVKTSALYLRDPESGELSMMAFSSEEKGVEYWNPVLAPGAGVSGLALREGRPVVVSDVLADPRLRFTPETRARIEKGPLRTGLSVPLVIQERAIGALTLADLPGRVFGPDEIQLVQAFADHAVLALENARLYAETERRRQAAESLAEIGRVLSESLDPQEVAERIVESVLALLGVQSSVLYRLEPGSGELVSLAFAGANSPLRESTVVLAPGTGTSGLAVRERRPAITANALEDPRLKMTPEIRARAERAGIYSAVSVPLIVRDEVIGALGVGDRLGRTFTPDEVRLIQVFADQAATALENARLFRGYQQKAEGVRSEPERQRRGTRGGHTPG